MNQVFHLLKPESQENASLYAGSRALLFLGRLFICTLLVLISSGCARNTDSDAKSFEQDPAAVSTVKRIQTGLRQSTLPGRADMDLLKSLHAKYPASAEVRQTLQMAFQLMENWDGIVELLLEKPITERTPQEQVNLAKAYLNLGNYHEATRILGPMAESAANDVELNSLAGQAWYSEGQYDQAARSFDRVWDSIMAKKKLEEIRMRGMIYFYKGDNERAISVLKNLVEINPNYIPAFTALSHVMFATGNRQLAESYLEKVKTIHARTTADEANKVRYVSRAHDLQNAWRNRRYEECELIARELLEIAAAGEKPVLYEYLAESYRAMGKQAEAQAAATEAVRLKQQLNAATPHEPKKQN